MSSFYQVHQQEALRGVQGAGGLEWAGLWLYSCEPDVPLEAVTATALKLGQSVLL